MNFGSIFGITHVSDSFNTLFYISPKSIYNYSHGVLLLVFSLHFGNLQRRMHAMDLRSYYYSTNRYIFGHYLWSPILYTYKRLIYREKYIVNQNK